MRCLRLESLIALLLLPWIAAWSPVSRAVLVQVGQEEGVEAEEGGGGEGASEEEAEEDSKEERWFAIAGADVHTGTGAVLRGATILSRNGVIKEIGYDPILPDGTEVLDATGFRAYPGLVAISSNGLFGGTSDIANTIDPFNSRMVLALAGGITTAVQGNEAAKLAFGEIKGVVMTDKVFVTDSFTIRTPSSKRSTREKLEAASKYLRKYRKWQTDVKSDKELKEPSKKGIDPNWLAVLQGEARMKFSADERTDLVEIANLALQYGFHPVIEGCLEGWTVADLLGRAGVTAIVTPRYRRGKGEDLVREGGSSIENAAILHRSGVQVCVIPGSTSIDLGGIVGRDILHLPIEAAFAVRGGMSEDAALDAITIVPARLMGLSHRIGSLEVGKDCDVIVTDGDILHYETFVQWSVVGGKLAYDKQAELWFAHIRPRPETAVAPLRKIDSGETDPEEAAAAAGADEASEGEKY
jgi:imidazolonepropionase-like amidohydrolase